MRLLCTILTLPVLILSDRCRFMGKKTDCSHQFLTSIPSGLDSSIENLDLSNNQISEIAAEAFLHLENLTVLFLNNNALTSKGINPSAFKGLEKLEILVLSDNQLTSALVPQADRKRHNLLREMLEPLTGLKRLYLDGNRLAALHDKTFDGDEVTPVLEELDLSRNSLRSIHLDAFVLKNTLKHLNLSHNLLDNLLPFEATLNLTVLDLSYNQLKTLDANIFSDLTMLENISLAYNQFTQVPAAALSALKNWAVLDLSGNPIEVLDENTFIKPIDMFLELDVLYLNNMSLTRIEKNALSRENDITRLEIRDNENLTYIDAGALERFDTLYTLDLRNNALTSLDQFTDFVWRSLKTLRLTGNQWTCDCKLQWLKNTIKSYNLSTDFNCSSPSEVAGRQFSSLPDLCPSTSQLPADTTKTPTNTPILTKAPTYTPTSTKSVIATESSSTVAPGIQNSGSTSRSSVRYLLPVVLLLLAVAVIVAVVVYRRTNCVKRNISSMRYRSLLSEQDDFNDVSYPM